MFLVHILSINILIPRIQLCFLKHHYVQIKGQTLPNQIDFSSGWYITEAIWKLLHHILWRLNPHVYGQYSSLK